MQAVRRGGARSTLLYNTIGKAQWEVLQLDASMAAGGGLARRVSLLDLQAQAQPQVRAGAHDVLGTPAGEPARHAGLPDQQRGPQLRAGAHGVHGTPAGGPARHASLPEQQSGLQLHDGVDGVHAASEGAEARHQSLPDQQVAEQLRTSKPGESVSVQAGHASVSNGLADLQPRVGDIRVHEGNSGLQAEAHPERSLPGRNADTAADRAGDSVKLGSLGDSR